MGFGAVLAAGENNELLGDDLLGALAEVRVEQTLDQPTLFALRFEDDICDGEPQVLGAAELAPEQMITVAVEASGGLQCLVRGPITEVKCSVETGGPGSSVQVHGQDRRVELDRQCFQHAWTGLASDAAHAILKGYGFTPEVDPTEKRYSEQAGTLNQRDTDLAFVSRIAGNNSFHLWLTYDCSMDPLDPFGGRVKVDETAHVQLSPSKSPGNSPAQQGLLTPSTDVRLRVHVAEPCQRNVTAFDVEVDVERPTSFDAVVVDDKAMANDRATAADRHDLIRPDGVGLLEVAGEKRTLCLESAGDAAEVQAKADAALSEAGWFVSATASTTAYLLKAVLKPHDVVEVEGLGKRHSGPYQVTAVTHVIHAADHFMDLTLRRNALGDA